MSSRSSVPSRALDTVYDPIYTTQTSPSSHLSRGNDRSSNKSKVIQGSGNNLIEGGNRAKYFKSPVIPLLGTLPTQEVLFSTTTKDNEHGEKVTEKVAAQKTIGVQTIFRESEAQTEMYLPEYTLVPGIPSPEILNVGSLPMGLVEVEALEKKREKLLNEKMMPPMTDEASFELRKKMMKQQELLDWKHREMEMDQVQEQKLNDIKKKIEEKCLEKEFLSEQRILEKFSKTQKDDEEAFQLKRIQTLRKLSKKRKDKSSSCLKRNIIEEYAKLGSEVVYASQSQSRLGIQKELLQNKIQEKNENNSEKLSHFLELEKSIPSNLFAFKIEKPKMKEYKTAKERKDIIAAAHLEYMENRIRKQQQAIHSPKKGAGWKIQVDQESIRPPTPLVPFPLEDENRTNSIILLQRLLRGRAIQNMMFEGKEKRSELIQELRASIEATPRVEEENRQILQDHENQTLEAAHDAACGEIISSLLDFLHKQLVRVNEHRKICGYVNTASANRIQREVREGGRRQAEELLRAKEDLVYRKIQRVHEETADHLIEEVMEIVLDEDASEQALQEMEVKKGGINILFHKMEESSPTDTIVKDLVASFLLPQVERQQLEKKVMMEERKFINAVHQGINDILNN